MVSSKTQKEIDESSEIDALKKVEAVLFISGRFLNMQELISLSDLNPLVIKESLDKLKERYEKSDSALEIIERTGLWKMDVGQEYTGIINKLATGDAEFTKAEQETLALVAYKQPMKQSVLIKIRGNKAYDHVKKFADLNLIKKKKSGHTNILTLSDEFYDYFNVSEKEGQNILKFKEEGEDKKQENSEVINE
jgi:segregation and condensation protein B